MLGERAKVLMLFHDFENGHLVALVFRTVGLLMIVYFTALGLSTFQSNFNPGYNGFYAI